MLAHPILFALVVDDDDGLLRLLGALAEAGEQVFPCDGEDNTEMSVAPVRNGNRWCVAGVDPKTNRLAAERLDDQARVVFGNDYLREHISLGHAVTVHSAQGVTADASHSVLSENTSRALLYVAMTRGRYANTARVYERISGDHEYGHQESAGTHLKNRGDSYEAAELICGILANDQPAITAHDYAARTTAAALPDRVQSVLNRRAAVTQHRSLNYHNWLVQAQEFERAVHKARERHASKSPGPRVSTRTSGVTCSTW